MSSSPAAARRRNPFREWQRHPADTARLVLAALVCAAAVAVATALPDGTRDVSADLVRLFDRLPGVVTRVLVGVLQVAALVVPLAALMYVRRGRWLELGLAAASAVVAGVAASLLDHHLRDAVAAVIIDDATKPSWVTGAAFPSGAYLAATAAVVTVLSPGLTLPWRRAGWWTIALVAVARVVSAVESPLNLVAMVSLGVAVGAAALVAVGAPARHPSPALVADALARAGVADVTLTPFAHRTSHGPAYTGVAGDGSPLMVKVIGRDERNADLLARMVRSLRVKGVEDDRPVTPQLAVEREALNAFLGAATGTCVPAVRAVATTADGHAVIALDLLDGVRLRDLPPEQLTDDVLGRAFAALAGLHRGRVAHRWADTSHTMLLGDGTVALLDMRWAEVAADDRLLAADLAELLTSLSLQCGVERTVAAATTVYSHDELAAALPLLQPLAVTPTTRRDLRGNKSVLGEVRAEVQRVTGVERYELVPMQRLGLKSIVTFFALLVIGNLLLTMVANWSDIWSVLKDADLATLPSMLILIVVGFVAGTWSLMGAVNVRLPFVRTTEVMFAQSFLNRFTPANAGGMALRARYLQRNGVELVVAAASVGLTSAASGVMQVAMAAMFFTWAGSSAESGASFSLPSVKTVLIVVIVVLAIAGVVAATAFGKRLFTRLRLELGTLLKEFAKLATQPLKLFQLFGGAFLGKLISVLQLAVALRAFDVDLGFAALGAMYITATTVAAAAPTPGGVGAIEAALTAGLVGLGVDSAVAVAAVLFFRLMTYWFTVLPCWLALRHLERADVM